MKENIKSLSLAERRRCAVHSSVMSYIARLLLLFLFYRWRANAASVTSLQMPRTVHVMETTNEEISLNITKDVRSPQRLCCVYCVMQ